MKKPSHRRTVPFGDLVVIAFDAAAQYSRDPEEVSRLATTAVMDLLRGAWTPQPSATRARPGPRGGATR